MRSSTHQIPPFGLGATAFVDRTAQAVGPEVEVRLAPPSDADSAQTIDISFVDLTTDRSVEADLVRRISGKLTLLVSVDHRQPEAIELLDRVIALVDEGPEELVPTSVDAGWWLAHGATPRPCVQVVVPGAIEKPIDPPDLVLQLDLEASDKDWSSGRRQLRGHVLMESGAPAIGARVTVTDNPELVTRTNNAGRFSIDAVFARSTVPVEVRAGRIALNVDLDIGPDNPPIILTGPVTRA